MVTLACRRKEGKSMPRSVVLWNDYKGSQEVINLENARLAQETINSNISTWNLAGSSVQQNVEYNGVNITPANGILVNTTNNAIKLNANLGIEIYNNKSADTDKRVFYVDTNGNVNLKGNIIMQGGSIQWNSVTAPDYSKIQGTKPPTDANNTYNELLNNNNIKGLFYNNNGKLELVADAITTGTMDAAKVTIKNLDVAMATITNLNVSAQQLLHETAFDFVNPKYWTASAKEVWTVDITRKFYSSNSLKVETSGLTADAWKGVFSEFVPAREGESFTVSYNIFCDDITTIDNNAYMYYEFFDETTRVGTAIKSIVPTENNKWVYSTVTAKAPANTVKVRIRFHLVKNGRFWLARPMLQRGSMATQWQLHTDEDIAAGAITADKIAAQSISVEHLTVSAGERGLIGHYFKNRTFGNYGGQQLDPMINFDWGSGGPAIIAPIVDNFSIRWQGFIYSKVRGTYTFSFTVDDGVILTLGTTVIVNSPTWVSGDRVGTVTLEADTWTPITIEYNEGVSTATCIMKWKQPGDTAYTVVPPEVLRPGMTKFDGGTITTGKIKAELIQIGPDSMFEEGYDPATPNALIYDPYFDRGLLFWSNSYEGQTIPSLVPKQGNGYNVIAGIGQKGGSVMEIKGASQWVFSKNVIPIEVNRIYRMRFRVRQMVTNGVGNNNVYAGVATLDGNYKNINTGQGNHRYFCVGGASMKVEDGWRLFEGIITGTGDTHQFFRPGTVYVRPMFLVNYQGDANGVAQVDMIEFADITAEMAPKGLTFSSTPNGTEERYLLHGFDANGQPDQSRDGFIFLNGLNTPVQKGYLQPGGQKGYLCYDTGNKNWYVMNMDNNQAWKKYNVGVAEHGAAATPSSRYYFLGYFGD